MTHIVVTLPIKAESVANLREHWRAKHARAQLHRTTAWAELRRVSQPKVILGPIEVTITRIAPRSLDSDNLVSSLKATRDGIADWLGIDDKDTPRLKWSYAQEKGATKFYAVRVEIKETAEALMESI